MRHIKNGLLIWFISTCVSLGVGGVSTFYFDVNFFLATTFGVLAFWTTFIPMLTVYIKRYRQANESSIYRKKMVQEANRKVKAIRNLKIKVRSIEQYRKIDHIYKVAKQIIKVVKEDPSRYYSAKRFFSDYLDSALMVIEKYTLFVQQPVKDREVTESLKNTEQALTEMTNKFEKELMEILSTDRMNLDLELEYVNQTLNDPKDIKRK